MLENITEEGHNRVTGTVSSISREDISIKITFKQRPE